MSKVPITNADLALGAETERRVGRNLLLYQRIENGLKRLLLQSYIVEPVADIERWLAERAAKIMRMNLGDAAKAVFEQVLTDAPKPMPTPPAGSETRVSSHFTIGPHPHYPDAIDALRIRCKAVADARNDLVHHFLRRTDQATPDQLRDTLDGLDAQYDAAIEMRDELLAHLRAMAEFRRSAGEYFASDRGIQALELAMAEGNVVDVLAGVTQSEARPDGWTLLTTALHRARAAVPVDVERLRQQFGQQWVRQVLGRCSAMFELADEPTPNGPPGSKRAIYRPRLR